MTLHKWFSVLTWGGGGQKKVWSKWFEYGNGSWCNFFFFFDILWKPTRLGESPQGWLRHIFSFTLCPFWLHSGCLCRVDFQAGSFGSFRPQHSYERSCLQKICGIERMMCLQQCASSLCSVFFPSFSFDFFFFFFGAGGEWCCFVFWNEKLWRVSSVYFAITVPSMEHNWLRYDLKNLLQY